MTVSSKLDQAIDSPRGQAHIIGAGIAITLLLLAALVPRTVPVVVFESGHDYVAASGYVEFGVEGYKIRNCQPVLSFVREIERDGKPILLYKAEIRGATGRWRETVVEFVDDESPGSRHEPGFFTPTDFGRWRVYYPRGFRVPPIAARVPMSHLCGEEGDTAVRTLMGSFRVKDAVALDEPLVRR